MKIVIADKVSPSALKVFGEHGDWTVVTPDKETLAAELTNADAIIVRSATFVDAAMMDKASKLRVIGRAGVGVDNVDLDAATKRGIVVMNTPGGNAVAVAEHTFGLMLSMARFLPRADASMHAGKWEKKTLQGTELRGKTLGIVGLGRVGVEVSRRALAFGMKVVAHDPYVAPSFAQQLNVTMVPLDELYAQSDYITLHVGLTPQTQGMINADALRKMKKGVKLVNCARGELLDEPAVVAALQSGQLGGAALDVYSHEPLKDSPLATLPNVILTPHIAGSTHEAQEAVGVQIALQVREYLLKGVIQNAVNVPSISEEEYQQMLPYISLGERLGTFLAQSCEGGVEEIGLSYTGEIAKWKTALIRNAAVAGALNQIAHAHERANLVNAASIAEERGIRLTERKVRDADGAAANVLRMTFKSGQQENTVAGCVQPGGVPHLLEIDGIHVEAPLEGNIIYLRNLDVPGVVGRVGTVLGKHNINIANFSLGRGKGGQEAVAVVQVDGEITDAVLDSLRGIETILLAKAIRFMAPQAKQVVSA
ncbi:MAG: phosphoglycerate dehydrogenase [Candidatus Korobacteraceae bacterium]|jgi:D-3-phosphoglycerate dehydrogenase / 2-oxoglutarate reductase